MNGPLRPAANGRRRLFPHLLTLCGLMLMGIGVFFAVARPALLPEDARSIGQSSSQIHAAIPGLARWLDKVFWVMGGYIFTTGLLVVYLARTAFRLRQRGAWIVAATAGATSMGTMTIVNFLLASDFRWPLLGMATLWIFALALFARGN